MDELHRLADRVGPLLDVPLGLLRQLGALVRRQLAVFRVPWEYHDWIVIGLWVLVLFVLLRALGGWLRLLVLLLAAALIARAYGAI
jgi:hypothetical protein